MANLLERNRFVRTLEAIRRWTICAACAATLASCGGGQRDAPAPSASPTDPTATDAAAIAGSTICDPITLAPPHAVSGTQRIAQREMDLIRTAGHLAHAPHGCMQHDDTAGAHPERAKISGKLRPRPHLGSQLSLSALCSLLYLS